MTGRAHIVVGLAWGDEGKGATVDLLAAHHRADRVVRFNGGQQAAHNVMVGDLHHTFQSYGSGTLTGVPTWISHFCTVEPTSALRERIALRSKGVDAELINVDLDALVTTGLHVAANRAREAARGEGHHGSTGRGFGETIAYSLDFPEAAPRVRDLQNADSYFDKLDTLARYYADAGLLDPNLHGSYVLQAEEQLEHAAQVFRPVETGELLEQLAHGHTIFEGAQGFWLDENFGFQPHTTWSTTTPANARRLAREAGLTDVTTVGALRTYATRHGAGPLPGEGQLHRRPAEPHNSDTAFAGTFRVGAHDPELLRACIDITQPDVLAVSHVDVYDQFHTTDGPMWLGSFAPLLVISAGPRREDRTLLRHGVAAA
ncbi:MAG: adenylosuccinate synthetase [Micropruina sp.]